MATLSLARILARAEDRPRVRVIRLDKLRCVTALWGGRRADHIEPGAADKICHDHRQEGARQPREVVLQPPAQGAVGTRAACDHRPRGALLPDGVEPSAAVVGRHPPITITRNATKKPFLRSNILSHERP